MLWHCHSLDRSVIAWVMRIQSGYLCLACGMEHMGSLVGASRLQPHLFWNVLPGEYGILSLSEPYYFRDAVLAMVNHWRSHRGAKAVLLSCAVQIWNSIRLM